MRQTLMSDFDEDKVFDIMNQEPKITKDTRMEIIVPDGMTLEEYMEQINNEIRP